MRYQIKGRQINIGEALQKYVRDELENVAAKYAQSPTDAIVTFSQIMHEYVCEISVHLSTGLQAVAKARENEIYFAFDSCQNRLEKQLRRYRRRLKDHHRQRVKPVESLNVLSYILSSGAHQDDVEPETLEPIIIAEVDAKIPSVSVGEAVMQMELTGSDFLVFKNEGKKNINVVYRRDDGNIGWIEPN